MKKLLLVIDLQQSFIGGKTKKLPLRINRLINSDKFDYIAFTRFINDGNSLWFNKLSFDGCMNDEDRKIVIDTSDYKIFDKWIYTAVNDQLKKYIKDNNISEIYLCGLDTDACVFKTAIDLFESGYNVYVLKDYCMSNAGFIVHRLALNSLKRLIGKDSIV